MTGVERGYAAADRPHGRRAAALMVVIALADHRGSAATGCRARADRLPADRGPGLSAGRACSCPTAPRSSARRRRWTRSPRSPQDTPGVDQVVTIAGISALDNSAALANAGVAYVILKDWSERGTGEDLLLAVHRPEHERSERSRRRASWCCRRRRSRASATPAASPCRSSCATAASTSPSCRRITDAMVEQRADARSSLQRVLTPFRAGVPQYRRRGRPREGRDAAASRSTRCSRRSSAYLGSTYVNQFNKFGRTFQVYVQADSQFRLRPRGHREPARCATSDGDMIPLGTLVDDHADDRAVADQPLQSLSVGDRSSALPAQGFSSGQAHDS